MDFRGSNKSKLQKTAVLSRCRKVCSAISLFATLHEVEEDSYSLITVRLLPAISITPFELVVFNFRVKASSKESFIVFDILSF